jgi:hypothetical protein
VTAARALTAAGVNCAVVRQGPYAHGRCIWCTWVTVQPVELCCVVSQVWNSEHKKSYDPITVINLMRFYWHRLIGTAGGWFFWDVAFYGNKLFQSTFIGIIVGKNVSLQTTLKWTLLNSAVALVGYYFAAFTVDRKWMGRVRMQNMGFLMCTIIFFFCSIFYDTLVKQQNIHWFQFLYFFSSFWGQFGPNCTTWLLPGTAIWTMSLLSSGRTNALFSVITDCLSTELAFVQSRQ